MREYILYAELASSDEGEWLEELPVQAESLRDARMGALTWARKQAREYDAKVLDAYAICDETGEQSQ